MGGCLSTTEDELDDLAHKLLPILKPLMIAELQSVLTTIQTDLQKENQNSPS